MFPRPCGGPRWAAQDGGTGPASCLSSASWEPLDILHCSAKPGGRVEGWHTVQLQTWQQSLRLCSHRNKSRLLVKFLNLTSAGNEAEMCEDYTTKQTNQWPQCVATALGSFVSANNYLVEFAKRRDEVCPLAGVLEILEGFVHSCHIVPVFGVTEQLHLFSVHSPEWLLRTISKYQAHICTRHLWWQTVRQTKVKSQCLAMWEVRVPLISEEAHSSSSKTNANISKRRDFSVCNRIGEMFVWLWLSAITKSPTVFSNKWPVVSIISCG